MKINRQRAERVKRLFHERFGASAAGAFHSAPGRTEIGGNHTDHQHGHVLCASVNLDMLAYASPNGKSVVRMISEGYPAVEVDLAGLAPLENEKNTTASLVRGIAAGFVDRNFTVGGFDAAVVSDVPAGSGLSSSAAFEVLIGTIFNHLFCQDSVDAVEIAKIGQLAENRYFGKPCGLMDQMGCSVGGVISINFCDPSNPIVERLDCDFSQSGYVLCVVDTGSQHADLTDDYADITYEMGAIAHHFGKEVLRDIPQSALLKDTNVLRSRLGERAVLRALHFYKDDKYAIEEAEALRAGDYSRFLSLVNRSGISSETLLQNCWSPANPKLQPIPLALAVGRELLDGKGAIRVHGGGFAGTVQAFVPKADLDVFRQGMESVFGAGKCHALSIRREGGYWEEE